MDFFSLRSSFEISMGFVVADIVFVRIESARIISLEKPINKNWQCDGVIITN